MIVKMRRVAKRRKSDRQSILDFAIERRGSDKRSAALFPLEYDPGAGFVEIQSQIRLHWVVAICAKASGAVREVLSSNADLRVSEKCQRLAWGSPDFAVGDGTA
jgi:hypothetical protein